MSAALVGALDIGGTHVTAGLIDVASSSVDRKSRVRLPLPMAGQAPELLAAITSAARSITTADALGLGVAVPGPFDYSTGVSRMNHKLRGLRGIDLRPALSTALGLTDPAQVLFVNDADAFLLGEWWTGAARGHARVVGITLGTGLGAAFMVDGRILRAGPGVPPGGALYELTFRGAPVEETISRHGLLRLYGVGAAAGLDVEQVAARAKAGEPAARGAFHEFGQALGEFLGRWLQAFEPSCLVVGGSIARSWALFETALRDSLAHHWHGAVTTAQHLDDAPLLGAARYVVMRPVHELSVAAARAEELAGVRATPTEPVAEVLERRLPGPAGEIPVRFYLPHGRPLPVLVYFFGGGWVLGSLDAADPVCRRLANATPCAVASVGYRRAPEHPFPAALDDCYAATRWLADHGTELGLDPSRMAVGGASSGGNLAAAVTLLARERDGPRIVFQLLMYPPVDRQAPMASMTVAHDGHSFGPEDLAWCWSHYLAKPADGESPLASPLRAPDLNGLPAALVITAELDPVRDQAEHYAARLAEAGIETELVRFDGAVHGFFSHSDELGATAEARAVAVSALQRALSRRT